MNFKLRATIQVLKKEKAELKSIALSIRTTKSLLKDTHQKKDILNEGNHHTKIVWGNIHPFYLEKKLKDLKIEYRHRHIAYCIIRGKRYDQIENSTKNSPNSELYSNYREKLHSDISLLEQILSSNSNKIIIDEEDQNNIFKVKPTKLNCFYFGVDRSHCGSCWQSDDEEIYFLATTKSLDDVKREFRKYAWNNYESMPNRKYSDFYVEFLSGLKYKSGWDCLYFHQTGRDYCPELSGSMYLNEYDVSKELNPETLFSKEEYESLLECVKHAQELEAKRKIEEEKRKKEIDKAQKEYDKEMAEYEKEKKKYDDYIKLRKEFEGDLAEFEVKRPKIKKPKLPDILDPKKRQKKALLELQKIMESVDSIAKYGYSVIEKKIESEVAKELSGDSYAK